MIDNKRACMDCGWKIHNKFLVYIKSFLEAVKVDEIIEINTKISKFLITTEVSCITCLIISFSDSPWFPPIVAIKRLSPITLSYAFHQLQSPPLEPNIHLYIVYTAPQEKIIMFFSLLCVRFFLPSPKLTLFTIQVTIIYCQAIMNTKPMQVEKQNYKRSSASRSGILSAQSPFIVLRFFQHQHTQRSI